MRASRKHVAALSHAAMCEEGQLLTGQVISGAGRGRGRGGHLQVGEAGLVEVVKVLGQRGVVRVGHRPATRMKIDHHLLVGPAQDLHKRNACRAFTVALDHGLAMQ